MKPRNEREAATLALLAKRKLRLEPCGRAWRIVGAGIDLLVYDWRTVQPADLRPVRSRE